ncbi:MAG: glycerol-3-phosphate 1-O-acyltransferase PlsY [Azoarcus sp.]|nr:glycerol-3-phosphate 1-O-acyltransferase PlsY [Azoarcus sp.]
MNLFLLVLAAYLVGSIPFAVVSSRLFGIADPRSYGSGNPGATNVLRSGSKAAAATTLIGDCLKGWFVVWLAGELGFSAGAAAVAGLAAFLGHVYSVFLRFRGGKGVATALGVLAGIDPVLALVALVVWLIVAGGTRYSSAAALAAAASAPLTGFMMIDDALVIGVLMAMTAALVLRHQENIRRLKNGTETRIGEK